MGVHRAGPQGGPRRISIESTRSGGIGVMKGLLGRISQALLMMAASSAPAQETGHTTDPLPEVKAKMQAKQAILVDVREQNEWDRGHVQGAVLLPLSQLMAW